MRSSSSSSGSGIVVYRSFAIGDGSVISQNSRRPSGATISKSSRRCPGGGSGSGGDSNGFFGLWRVVDNDNLFGKTMLVEIVPVGFSGSSTFPRLAISGKGLSCGGYGGSHAGVGVIGIRLGRRVCPGGYIGGVILAMSRSCKCHRSGYSIWGRCFQIGCRCRCCCCRCCRCCRWCRYSCWCC